MNFGIGNYFFKLPRGGKVFCVGHYIHLQGEGILFIVIYRILIIRYAIWKSKSRNIAQWKLVHSGI
jgi:hypothetical protein